MHSSYQVGLICAGPRRTGTTWLHECLEAHPQLSLPTGTKETFFFDQHFSKGWDWYWSHFDPESAEKILGEVGPSYFTSEPARDRIRSCSPECRILVSLRHPAERVHSYYRHCRRTGRITAGFDDAIIDSRWLLEGSRYATHAPRWIEAFSEDQVKFILLDDIKMRPVETLAEVWHFLGVSRIPAPGAAKLRIYSSDTTPRFPLLARAATRVSSWLHGLRAYRLLQLLRRSGLQAVYAGGGAPAEMNVETRMRLAEVFREDIDWVEDALGRDLSHWRS